MDGPPLWLVERNGTTVRIFGHGLPLAEPWSSPEIETMVAGSDVFWTEIPKIGDDAQALAIKYGFDADAPLASWLSPHDLARAEAAAIAAGADPQLLARVRPWLAAQMLPMAAQSLAGLHGEYAVEERLTAIAERAGVPVHSEFPTIEALFVAFSSWPRDIEIERLLSAIDDVEAGIEALKRKSRAWLERDEQFSIAIDNDFRRKYPKLYEHLVIRRNEAWVPRIRDMLDERTRAFIVVGEAHLIGPYAIPVLLDRAGITARHA